MKEAQERIDLLLNEIEETCPAPDYNPCLVPFMLECASLIESRMPSLAVKALETARAYSAQEKPLASVRGAIEDCWHSVNQSSIASDDPDACAIRALICVLHEQSQPGSADLVDLLSFFLNLLNRVEPHGEEQIGLINKHFSPCLDKQTESRFWSAGE